ncbi:putative ADP-heptose:LPS heptosyltransferase [Vibrio nigripulchritudo MADA3029]|uniref:glycosyltransferase family 9 protein n=1 Tax=Vibrio nigripulchritudo TaxID=28173 RepID=UPI0003B18DC2|nr:glycosyltransferase family 9 protein [Vibrio nigripulchritudo]CCN47592.1 putative ADP-heptose:LPS heptosyltransferase [Vibrio nigripulchritudo MADA3020]CCN56584.1 putative ADP-heptose:LPS heptosyltransferase [Vibrio nigripulchritudo MADA3021]CCN58791.1 putative ADP-heptose:LPS heptosyltransferase [Vibrio nigripulchritudo MADA3029]
MLLFASPPDSICVLRLSAIGDVCNTIAAIQAIQAQWPETRITWITGKLEAQLLQSIEGIEVIVFDKNLGWRGYTSVWRQLKGRRFDALLHMQYAMRASVVTLGIRAKYKLGFDKIRSQDAQHWFTNVRVPSPEKMHVLDGLLAFNTCLGLSTHPPTWFLKYDNSAKAWAKKYLSTNVRNLIVVPGASKSYKNWTVAGYVELIEYVQKKGWNVILAGSPSTIEEKLAANIVKKLDGKVVNLVGKSSLMEMLSLLDQSDLVVAPDTGPVHMANAMNTPVIGLYAHHNPARTGPYLFQNYVVSVWEQEIETETGKKVDALPWRSRVKNKNAMQNISSTQVIEMFDRVCREKQL